MAKTRRDYSKLTTGQKGWITRRARAAGKDPKRVHAGFKAAETRRANEYRESVRHGLKARKHTERKLTPEVFQRRATRGRQLKKDAEYIPGDDISLGDLPAIKSTDDDWEIEGHQEFDQDGEAPGAPSRYFGRSVT